MSDPVASEVQPEKILAGFEKVRLAPGERKTVAITIPTERFMTFSEQQKKQVLEPGEFKVWAAQDSRDVSTEAVLRVVG